MLFRIFIFSHLKLSCGHVAGIVLLAIIKFTQPVLVERESPTSRQDTVKEIQRRAATGGTWPQIVVFTEGTCTNRSCLISFKPGITYFCTTHAVWHDQIYYARVIFLRNFYFLLRYLLLFQFVCFNMGTFLQCLVPSLAHQEGHLHSHACTFIPRIERVDKMSKRISRINVGIFCSEVYSK